jgi:cellobiose transport system substrate-binding protein
MMAVPEDWAELPEVPDRWVDWKVAQGSVDGTITGYGTDIGPLAIAFNQDMLSGSGLAADPESFGELIGGDDATWQSFLDAGRQYVATSDNYFVDSLTNAFQAAINLLPAAFEDPESGLPYDLADNTEVKDLFMMFADAAEDDISAGIAIGHADWGAGFQNKQWASVVTPAWMTGIIAENADGVDGWRIASTFPEGGGNWGGSFFAVPSTGPNTAWAIELADYLTTPDAAIDWFDETGQFPSQLEAMSAPEIAEAENPFFGDQRVGQIYGDLAAAAGDAAAGGYRGENFAGIQTLVTDGIRLVESDSATAEQAWESVVAEFDALGFETAS